MDNRLRALERRWKETGAPEDEARYLREGVRCGSITTDRITLAAYCGNPAALLLLLDHGVVIDCPSDLRSWVKTVALEVPGWRVVAWLLHTGLSEAYRIWSYAVIQEQNGPAACVSRVVSILQLAADTGHRAILDELGHELTTLIEQHAARERMWDGAGQEGFVVHLALRAIEIVMLDRPSHTGEIVDRCAQAIHRLHRERDELAVFRTMLKQAIKRSLTARAFGTAGPLRGYPPTPIPFSFVMRTDVEGPCPECSSTRYLQIANEHAGWVFCKQGHRSKAPRIMATYEASR